MLYFYTLIAVVLSVENAVSAIIKTDFEVDWLKDDRRFRFSITDEQNAEIGKYSDTREEKIRSFITYVLNADPTPSWRRIISAIDQLDTEHAVASELYEYAEPITGMLTVKLMLIVNQLSVQIRPGSTACYI